MLARILPKKEVLSIDQLFYATTNGPSFPIHTFTMATYDSDSSDGEDGDYTKTTTLLGYAAKDPTDDPISQLGGYPVSMRTPVESCCTDTIHRHG